MQAMVVNFSPHTLRYWVTGHCKSTEYRQPIILVKDTLSFCHISKSHEFARSYTTQQFRSSFTTYVTFIKIMQNAYEIMYVRSSQQTSSRQNSNQIVLVIIT